MSTPSLEQLTLTEIQNAVRKRFEGRHLSAVSIEPLLKKAQTLQELFSAIEKTLNEFDKPCR